MKRLLLPLLTVLALPFVVKVKQWHAEKIFKFILDGTSEEYEKANMVKV